MVAINSSSRSITYNPVNSAGPFPVGDPAFPVFDAAGADLRVTLDGEEVDGWTFSGTLESGWYGAPNTWANGSITFAQPVTGELVIDGVRAPRRQARYDEGRGLPARDVNTEFDILTAVDQEFRRDIDRLDYRAVRVPFGERAVTIPPVSQRRGRLAAYDLAGMPIPADAVVVSGVPTMFSSRLAAQAATIDPALTFLWVAGFYLVGDGGSGAYRRAASEPSHDAKFQSSGGAWWELIYQPRLNVAVMGAQTGASARAAIQGLIDFVANFGGGDVDVTGGRWLIDDDHLYVRKGVRLIGPWEMIGEVEGLDYSTIKGALVLANGKELRLWDDFAAVRGVAILKDGLTKPTTLRQTLDLVKNMSGVAVRIGDGTNSKANDAYVGHCIILGFDQAIYCDYSERPTIEYVRGDCRNGIYTTRIYDLQTVRSCHFWPFLTVRGTALFGGVYQFAVSNVVDNGSGACRVSCATQPGDDGDVVIIAGVGGVTGANGRFTLDVIDANTVDLVGSTFAGAYTSGGNVIFPWNSRFGRAYFFDTDTDWAEAVDCFSYGYDKGFEVKDVGRATLVNCGADHTPAFQDKTTIAFHLTGNDRAPVLLGCKGSAVGTSVKIETTATVNTTAQIIGHRAWGIQNYAYWFADGDANLIGCEANASAILRFENTCGRISFTDCVFPSAGLSNFNAQAAAGKIASHNTVGIPDNTLTVVSSVDQTEVANLSKTLRAASTGEGFQTIAQKSRGTLASPAAVQAGDNIFDAFMQGHDGSAFVGSGRWRYTARGAISTGIVPVSAEWYSQDPSSGAERLRFQIDEAGNIVAGDAALATNATNGFFYLTSGAGVPTGTPTTKTGRIPVYVDTTNFRVYFYIGGAWKYVALI